MFNSKLFESIPNLVINCAEVDLKNYSLQIKPEVDILYLHNNIPCNPIYQTDWIEIDVSNITDKHIFIPNDNTQKSINDLIDIITYIYKSVNILRSHMQHTIVQFPRLTFDIIDRNSILKIYSKHSESFLNITSTDIKDRNGPIKIKFQASFNASFEPPHDVNFDPSYMYDHCLVNFNVLSIDILNEDIDDIPTIDNIDDLSLMVSI